MHHVGRRAFIAGTLLACTGSPPAAPVIEAATKRLDAIESDIGGRLGVCALDCGSGGQLVHRAAERFAMCSTFKWMLVAHVYTRADRGLIELDESVAARCEAAIVDSDNTATNALLARTGGPAAFTKWLRSIGDDTTRLDRDEPLLNENGPGDARDTTTPEAMVQTMKTLLVGDVLAEKTRTTITDAMKRCRTGTRRLRAGFPKDWTVGDKTGTGEHGAVNDVAIVWRKYHSPILVACFTTEVKADLETAELAHTRVARIVAETFA